MFFFWQDLWGLLPDADDALSNINCNLSSRAKEETIEEEERGVWAEKVDDGDSMVGHAREQAGDFVAKFVYKIVEESKQRRQQLCKLVLPGQGPCAQDVFVGEYPSITLSSATVHTARPAQHT